MQAAGRPPWMYEKTGIPVGLTLEFLAYLSALQIEWVVVLGIEEK